MCCITFLVAFWTTFGAQNEVKIVKNRVKMVSRERSRLECEKSLNKLPYITLWGGFSPAREHSFHFFTLARKGIQKGSQKLWKWRPGALRILSGEGFKTYTHFFDFGLPWGSKNGVQHDVKIIENVVLGGLWQPRGLQDPPRDLQRVTFGPILVRFSMKFK